MKEFYNRVGLSNLFDNEHELSNLLAENPGVVAEWIGEDDLTFHGREDSFVDVRADIIFITTDGRLVEVEVQRGDADDQHLGEIVRHVSQIQAHIVVWVAQAFNRQINRVFRQWNEEGSRDYYTVEIHGVEDSDLLGWSVIESPYTLDRDVERAKVIRSTSKLG